MDAMQKTDPLVNVTRMGICCLECDSEGDTESRHPCYRHSNWRHDQSTIHPFHNFNVPCEMHHALILTAPLASLASASAMARQRPPVTLVLSSVSPVKVSRCFMDLCLNALRGSVGKHRY